MADKQEYIEGKAESHNSGSVTNVSDTIAENLRHEMEHETTEQAELDIEMSKGLKTNQEPPSRRWIVLATATLGALFVSLQGSALIVALPDLMKNLNVNIEGELLCSNVLMFIGVQQQVRTRELTHVSLRVGMNRSILPPSFGFS